jgi:hypothetical protein
MGKGVKKPVGPDVEVLIYKRCLEFVLGATECNILLAMTQARR